LVLLEESALDWFALVVGFLVLLFLAFFVGVGGIAVVNDYLLLLLVSLSFRFGDLFHLLLEACERYVLLLVLR